MSLNTMTDLLVQELRGMHSAETQLTHALPKMAAAARSATLSAAFKQHLLETEAQVLRLEQMASLLGVVSRGKVCQAMQGLIAEGEETIAEGGDHAVIDAALIAAAQRVEHFEIASYGTLRTFAGMLGHAEIVRLVDATLEEERAADTKLTMIAEAEVNLAPGAAAAPTT